MSLSVLLASRHEVNTETLKRGLIVSGYKEISAVKGMEDFMAVIASGAKFDLAVIDIENDFETDLALLSAIRKFSPETECIAVSPANDADLAMECVKRGACDFMSMPFSKDSLAFMLKKAMIYKKPAGARPRILIMEDDPVSGRLMQKYLAPYGECTLTVDGLEAVRAFEQAVMEHEIYQLLILDIMVPEIHGKEVLRRIRAIETLHGVPESRKSRVIMTTALSDAANVVESFKCKCDSYLVKPIDRNILARELAHLGFGVAVAERPQLDPSPSPGAVDARSGSIR